MSAAHAELIHVAEVPFARARSHAATVEGILSTAAIPALLVEELLHIGVRLANQVATVYSIAPWPRWFAEVLVARGPPADGARDVSAATTGEKCVPATSSVFAPSARPETSTRTGHSTSPATASAIMSLVTKTVRFLTRFLNPKRASAGSSDRSPYDSLRRNRAAPIRHSSPNEIMSAASCP